MLKMTDTDLGFNKIKLELEKLGKMKVIIKIDPSKTYESGLNVDLVAMWMEYGADEFNVHYPARPFFRSAIDANMDKIKLLYEKRLDLIVQGRMTAKELGEELGRYVKEKVQEMIMYGEYEVLAESTIANKGSDKPLMDTKKLYGSIIFEIEEG